MINHRHLRWKSYLQILGQLIKTDLVIFTQRGLLRRIINTICWISTVLIVTTYIFPLLGMTSTFGAFMAITSIGSLSYFDIFGATMSFLSDLSSDRTYTFGVTLPIPSFLFFISHVFSYALRVAFLSSLILPLAKIILWNRFDLSNCSLFKALIIFITLHIFSGAFFLLVASKTKNVQNIMNSWDRILFPLWFFGGSQCPWITLHAFVPTVGYAALANPFLYGMEGLHNAFLGSEKFLPFWLCISVLLLTAVLCCWVALGTLKKRLDFV